MKSGLSAVCIHLLMAVGCGKEPEPSTAAPASPGLQAIPILGQWHDPDEGYGVEFLPNGTVILSDNRPRVVGRYSWLNPTTLRIQYPEVPGSTADIVAVSVSGSGLSLAGLNSRVMLWHRGAPLPAVRALRSNERTVSASLKTLCAAEATFRGNDHEGNRVMDYWTGDVAGLYSLTSPFSKEPMKLIDLSVALADSAPLEEGAAGGGYVAITRFGVRAPHVGYYFRAMRTNRSGGSAEEYQQETESKMGKVHNLRMFGFCAYPAEYGKTGMKTFIVSEQGQVYWSDTQGQIISEWPGTLSGWKLHF